MNNVCEYPKCNKYADYIMYNIPSMNGYDLDIIVKLACDEHRPQGMRDGFSILIDRRKKCIFSEAAT